jgi:hypothetical protein
MRSEWEDLKIRVNRLERQNGWLKMVVSISVLIFIGLITMGQSKVAGTIEAQRFVLKAANGEVRAELTTLDGDYPRLSLRSPNGEKEVGLSPVGLSMFDHALTAHGHVSKLPLAHYSNVGLYFADANGKVVLEVGGAATQKPQLTAVPEISIFDKNDKQVIWHAP